MPAINLTAARAVEKLSAPGWYSMLGQPSFGVRVSKAGSKSWYWQGRIDGRQVWKQLGRVGDVTLDDARALALSLGQQKAAAKLGQAEFDPVLPAAEPAVRITLRDAWAFYWTEHLGKKASGPDVRDKVTAHATELLDREVADLDAEDVAWWWRKFDGSTTGKHVVQALKAACYLAAEHPKRSHWPKGRGNPFAGIKLPKSNARTRKLVGDDLKRFIAQALQHDDPAVRAFVVGLTVTGARLSEFRLATVQQYDRERRRIRIPKAQMKNRKEDGTLTLGPVSAQLLDAVIGKRTTGYIFEGASKDGSRDFRKPWTALCKATGIDGYSFHDSRRTAASVLDAAKFDGVKIETFLNHTLSGVEAHYRAMDADDPMRDEMAAEIERACGLEKRPARRTEKPQARRSK